MGKPAERVMTHSHKLTARSLPTLVRETEDAVSALAREGLKFRGRKVSAEAYINAAVSALNRMTVADRLSLVSDHLRRIEALLPVEGVPDKNRAPDALNVEAQPAAVIDSTDKMAGSGPIPPPTTRPVAPAARPRRKIS